MLKLEVTASTPQDGESNYEHIGIDLQQFNEVIKLYIEELEAHVWSSLVITIVRVQS